jgi:hypothetical protein
MHENMHPISVDRKDSTRAITAFHNSKQSSFITFHLIHDDDDEMMTCLPVLDIGAARVVPAAYARTAPERKSKKNIRREGPNDQKE